jgi:hypothetical protein
MLALLGCAIPSAQAQIGSLFPAGPFESPTYITLPTLTPVGGTLLLSDSPEEISSSQTLPGALYRDSVSGLFRVFYHHQNTLATDVRVGVAITNTSTLPELIFSHGVGSGISVYPNAAGQAALDKFLATHGTTGFVTLLKPGKSYIAAEDNPAGDTDSAIKEYIVVSVQGSSDDALPLSLLKALDGDTLLHKTSSQIAASLPISFAAGPATVTTLVYSGKAPTAPATIAVLAADSHIRGTFAHADRTGAFTIASSAGLQALAIDTSAPGEAYSNDMPGEYELGTDAVDANAQVYNDGNYGVLYHFTVTIKNGAKNLSSSPVGLLMQPTGGAGNYVFALNGSTKQSPYVDYTSVWWFGEVKPKSTSAVITLETSLTGGSAGPQQLLFDPKFTGK